MVKEKFYNTTYKNISEMVSEYYDCCAEQKDIQTRLLCALKTLIHTMYVRNATEMEMTRATQYCLALYDGHGLDFETPIARDVEALFEKYLLTPLSDNEICRVQLSLMSKTWPGHTLETLHDKGEK